MLDPYRPLRPHRRAAPGRRPTSSRWRSRWWRSTGSGCSSIPSRASPRSTSWPRRWTGRSASSITASTVMNSFYVPGAGRQIYAMPGMETKLHAVINKPGVYEGFSANYSGAGFSGMRFKFHGLSDARLRQLGARPRRERPATLDPRRLPGAGEAERARAGAPLRQRRRRPVRRHPEPLRRRRQDVHERDDGHRRRRRPGQGRRRRP